MSGADSEVIYNTQDPSTECKSSSPMLVTGSAVIKYPTKPRRKGSFCSKFKGAAWQQREAVRRQRGVMLTLAAFLLYQPKTQPVEQGCSPPLA